MVGTKIGARFEEEVADLYRLLGATVVQGVEVCQKKVRYIMDVFQSQRTKSWFQEDTFLSLMRLRGMECNAPSGYAEAFYARKIVL